MDSEQVWSHSCPLIKRVFPTLHRSESPWEPADKVRPGQIIIRLLFMVQQKTVYASWSNPLLHHMNHTFPLLPIFTAAAHLDLLERFAPLRPRKTRNPECSGLGFSQSLCFLTLSAQTTTNDPLLTSERTHTFMPTDVCVCERVSMMLHIAHAFQKNLIWEWVELQAVFPLWFSQLTLNRRRYNYKNVMPYHTFLESIKTTLNYCVDNGQHFTQRQKE